MNTRVALSREQLRQALAEQVELLQLTCRQFDQGNLVTGRQISTVLRTLLYSPAGGGSRTVPLLRRLDCYPPRFLNLAVPIDPKRWSVLRGPKDESTEHVPACGLVDLALYPAGAAFFAPLDDVQEGVRSWERFSDWWTQPVMRDHKGRTLSRLALVQHVADTDGGAHVDGGLMPDYADAKSGVALGLCIQDAKGRRRYLLNLELHCMRQIAHEVLSTFRRYLSWTFKDAYPHPMTAAARPAQTVIKAGICIKGEASFALEGEQFLLIGAA